MTETVTENADVAGYLAAVRQALGDLPASDYDDLLEDLEAHLYEVLAESGGASLESSLGSPASYADELRASAGLDPASGVPETWSDRALKQVRTSELWLSADQLRRTPMVAGLLAFLSTLRPAWWLLRGWCALLGFVIISKGRNSGYRQHALWVPVSGERGGQALVVTVLFVLASAWLGLRTLHADSRVRGLVALGNAVILLLTLYGLSAFLASAPSSGGQGYTQSVPASGLWLNGRQVLNLYPYDLQGHPLTGVRLYDDQRQPLSGLADQDEYGNPVVHSYPTDSTGAVVANAYPQITSVPAEDLPIATVGPAAPVSGAASARVPALPSSAVGASQQGLVVPPMQGAGQASSPALVQAPEPAASSNPSVTPTPSPTARPTPAKLTPRATASPPAHRVKPRPTSS